MTPSIDDLRTWTLTTRELCGVLGVSRQMVGKLVDGGHLKRLGKDQFRLVDGVRGYCRFLSQALTERSTAEARLCDQRAKEIEVRIQMRLDRLAPIDDFPDMVGIMAGAFFAELAGQPERCGRNDAERAAIEQDIAGIRERIAIAADKIGEGLPLPRPLGDAVRRVDAGAIAAVERKVKN